MLVAAKVDPENPWRAANIINAHPGVSHNYLRNHEFNIWFTIATEPDSQLGLQGTLDVLAKEAGAESVRQLPTLKLFKIRMDLEMEGGTEALSQDRRGGAPGGDRAPALRRVRPGRDPRHPGGPAGDLRALRARRAGARDRSSSGCSTTCRAMQERRLLRRVAAILFHRRAGFSANGMGVWKVPDDRILEIGARMASFRGISHCYQRPTYADWPYSVFTMAHGRSKEECDAILDSIAEPTRRSPTARRCTRRPSSRRSGCSTSPPSTATGSASTPECDAGHTAPQQLYERALKRLPGGVNSPVRAMRSIGRDPIFIASGSGSRIRDVDGNEYVDWVCSWGPLILGHAYPSVVAGGHPRPRATARASARRRPARCELAEEIADRMPSVEMVRMTSSGTEATMSALRLARAVTGRYRVLKFAGAYHGHVDGLLAEAGSGLATQGIPASPGVPEVAAAADRDRALERLREALGADRRPGPGGDHRRAGARQHGPRAAGRRLPGAAARGGRPERRAADLRRGDLGLPGRARRRPGAVRRRPGPDGDRQDRRRRAAGRRLRRPDAS